MNKERVFGNAVYVSTPYNVIDDQEYKNPGKYFYSRSLGTLIYVLSSLADSNGATWSNKSSKTKNLKEKS